MSTASSSSPSADLALDSLRRRVRALYSLYDDAVASMDLGQVNHLEREGVVPIAFSLSTSPTSPTRWCPGSPTRR